MKTALSIGGILAILCVVTTYGHTFRRDYNFDKNAGVWVKFHPMPMKWEDAALRCFYEGAILATPINNQISNTLFAIMDKHKLMKGPMFTGISNVYARNEYQSMEGIPLTNIDLKWSDAPTVDDMTSNCLLMYSDGTFSAVPTTDRYPFVCYRHKDAETHNECGTLDPGYELNNRTRSCYKVYKEKQSWSEAFESCAVDGAHLAVINSETEAEVLYELSNDALPNSGNNDFVLIGFRAWGPKRAWITIQGQSLNDAGYAKWYKGEPNNFNEKEACGAIVQMDLQPGILNDISCDDYRNYFICEIDNVD